MMLRSLGRALDLVMRAGAALAGALIVFIMALVCLKVLLRYGFNVGIVGVDQISGSLLLYITFLGAAWVARQDGHVRVDILTSGLGQRTRALVDTITSFLVAAACAVVFFYSTDEVIFSLRRNINVAAELEIPRAINLAVIPLGTLLLAIEFARQGVRRLGVFRQRGEA